MARASKAFFLVAALLPVLFTVSPADAAWIIQGSTTMNGSEVVLTPAQTDQAGAAWLNWQIDLSQDFDITYSINLGNRDASGADGISFCMQRDSRGTAAVPGTGGGGEWIGMYGIYPAIAVEVDTYQNSSRGDPANDHIGINEFPSNGSGVPNHAGGGPINALTSGGNIETGNAYAFRLQWTASTRTLNVYFNNVLRLSYTRNFINNIFGGQTLVWWGFVASTGGSYNRQTLTPTDPVVTVIKPVLPTTIPATGTVTYEIRITNSGTSTAWVSQIIDIMPTRFKYVAGSSSGITTSDPTQVDQTLTWNVVCIAVAPGASRSLFFQNQAPLVPGNYCNYFSVIGSNFTTITGNCQNQLTVTPIIYGYVFNDANANGAYDWTETGLGTTTYVKLCQSGSVMYVADVDPSTGYYAFLNAPTGTYTILEDTDNLTNNCVASDPAGWVSSTPNSLTKTFSTTMEVDFGDFYGARVQGTVFEDKGSGVAGSLLANNAVYNSPTELGIQEVAVRACQDGACASVISQTATNGAGQYEFYIPASYTGQTIYILETDPGTYLSTGNSIAAVAQNTTAQSVAARNRLSFTMASGTEYSAYNFGDVLPLGITPPQSYIVGQGSTLSIAHAVNLQTPGAAAVSLASQEAWQYVVYEDSNCDGQPDGNPLVPSGGYYALNGGAGLGNGTSCLVLRLMVPSTVPAGTVEKLSVIANENWSNTSGTNADTGTIYDDLATVLDTITVAAGTTGEIRLEKFVRNVTLGQGFSFSNTASPCDVLEYKINFKNIGARNQSSLVLGDNVPMGTEFLLNRYNGSTSDVQVSVMGSTYYGTVDDSPDSDGATLANDALVVDIKKLSLNAYGTLTPGQSGSLLYQVYLQDACP